MVNYKCDKCDFSTNLKGNYNRHLETKKHKKKENEGKNICTNLHQFAPICTNLHQFAPSQNQDVNQNTNNSLIKVKTGKKECKYCGIKMTRNHIARHQRTTCDKIPQVQRNRLLKKYQNHKSSKNEIVLYDNNNNNNNTTVNNSNNNNSNNNTITNSNNTINNNNNNGTINNITIKINPLGKEDLSFLTNKDKIDILKCQHMGIPELIKRVHAHPSNHNFYLPNINKKMLAYLDDNNRLKYDSYDEVCMQIIDDNVGRFDDIFNEFGDELNKKIRKKIEQVIEANGTDIDINRKYIEAIKFHIINWSKDFKNSLDKYMDELNQKLELCK